MMPACRASVVIVKKFDRNGFGHTIIRAIAKVELFANIIGQNFFFGAIDFGEKGIAAFKNDFD